MCDSLKNTSCTRSRSYNNPSDCAGGKSQCLSGSESRNPDVVQPRELDSLIECSEFRKPKCTPGNRMTAFLFPIHIRSSPVLILVPRLRDIRSPAFRLSLPTSASCLTGTCLVSGHVACSCVHFRQNYVSNVPGRVGSVITETIRPTYISSWIRERVGRRQFCAR